MHVLLVALSAWLQKAIQLVIDFSAAGRKLDDYSLDGKQQTRRCSKNIHYISDRRKNETK